MSIPLVTFQIRKNAIQIGYDARMSGSYIPNPYQKDSPFFQHWEDGYDYGVREANEDLEVILPEAELYLIEDFMN